MTEAKHIWEPLRKATPQVHWLRLENLVGTGMCDVNGCLNGIEVWVENKIIHGNQIVFRPKQPAWMLSRMMHGGRVFVLARRGDWLHVYSQQDLRVLLKSCQPRGKNLVADYRIANGLTLEIGPQVWDFLLGYLFGHKDISSLKAA